MRPYALHRWRGAARDDMGRSTGLVDRDSVAYARSGQALVEFAADTVRTTPVAACEIPVAEFLANETVIAGGTVTLTPDVIVTKAGVRWLIGHTATTIYRRAEGTAGWIAGATIANLNRVLIGTAAGSLIVTTSGSTHTVYRSGDLGDTLVRVQDGAGSDLVLTDVEEPEYWATIQDSSGTIFLAAYTGAGDVNSATAKHIYISEDDGVNFTIAYTGTTAFSHFHALCEHFATHTLVAAAGDRGSNGQLTLKSPASGGEPDGSAGTWAAMYTTQPDMQPTALLDVGHPTRLLFGSDREHQIGWIDVVTGEVACIHEDFPRALVSNQMQVFSMFLHGGVLYASSYVGASSPRYAAIVVCANFLDDNPVFTTYYRFASDEKGVYHFVGFFDGKLHGRCDTGAASHFTVTPTAVRTALAAAQDPAATNLLDSTLKSSGEGGTTGWAGSKCVLSSVAAENGVTPVHGSNMIKAVCNSAGTVVISTPTCAATEGSRYGGEVWVRAAQRAYSNACYVLDGINQDPWTTTSYGYFGLSSGRWQRVPCAPVTIPDTTPDVTTLKWNIYIPDAQVGDVFYVDAAMLGLMPTGRWQVGGTARAAEMLQATPGPLAAWTWIASVWPAFTSTLITTKLYVRTLIAGLADELNLSWDGPNQRWHLDAPGAESAYTTGSQWHLAGSHLRFAMRGDETGVRLSVANGGVIEHLDPLSAVSYVSSAQSGSVAAPESVLPCSMADERFFALCMTEAQIEAELNRPVCRRARRRRAG